MHILFTRSLEDSKDLILRFNELGHKVSYMPVIQIKKVDHDVINFNDFKGKKIKIGRARMFEDKTMDLDFLT